MYYDVHLLDERQAGDPHAALVQLAAHDLAQDRPDVGPVADADAVSQIRDKWVRPGEGLRIDDEHGSLTVRLPYWYFGKPAREQAKVLHAVVKDLEQATGRRGFDPQLEGWLAEHSWKDTVAVLEAVADFQAREHVDSPAVDARRTVRENAGRPRPFWKRRT